MKSPISTTLTQTAKRKEYFLHCLRKARIISMIFLIMAALFIFISKAFSQESNDSSESFTVLHSEGDSETNRAGSNFETLSHSRQINDGQIDHGHPAVGLVGRGCTGTLIGSRTVLTAAHCIEPGDITSSFEVGGQVYWGQVTRHPNYDENNNIITKGYDLAIINLLVDVPGIMPIPLARTSPDLRQMPVTIVGFGLANTDSGESKVKRQGRSRINYSRSDIVIITNKSNNTGKESAQARPGDSGGPMLLDETATAPECVIGVAAYIYWGHGQKDFPHTSLYARPDGVEDWINGLAAGDPTFRWVTPCGKICWKEGEDENGMGGIEKCRTDACYWLCDYYVPDQPEDDWELKCFWR